MMLFREGLFLGFAIGLILLGFWYAFPEVKYLTLASDEPHGIYLPVQP